MWYWTLPSLALTGACLIIPAYLNALGNYAATGHVIYKKLYIYLFFYFSTFFILNSYIVEIMK